MDTTRPAAFCLLLLLAPAACSDSRSAPAAPSPDAGDCAPLKNLADVIRVYGAAWNERAAEKRLCALEKSMLETATYIDPTIDTANLADLADAIGDFQTSAPTASIAQISGLDARTGELRFAWDVRNDGASVITGLDYVEISAEGRIASIRGYWDPVPTAPATGVLMAYVAAWKATDAASRRASLELAVANDVRFTSPDNSATGLQALSEAMPGESGGSIEVTGAQPYPKYARVTFSIDAQEATDYLHLGADGKIVRIARFIGPLPAL